MCRHLPLLLLSLLSSCIVGRQDINDPLDATVVATLRPGSTSAREVVEKLGAPTEVVQLGRRTAYRFDASTTKSTALILLLVNLGAQDTRSDRLWAFFDDKDVLTHYGVTYGVHRTQYALPWEDVHEAEDNAARDRARPGLGSK